ASSKGKKRASAAKKGGRPAAKKASSSAGDKKKKAAAATKAKKRVSAPQINEQLKVVKHIKERLKEVVDRFEGAYPEGLDFAPNANNDDFA
ncbi:unnamed protein product, partial [Hapterophycus canaliculatus]